MPIVLYKIDASPPSRAVNMVVELLGLNVETKIVNTLAGEQFNPEFLKINHLHTVPVIKDGDFILPESHAIITYLVSKYGADKRAQLYPSDLRVRATVDQRLYLDTSTLFPRFGAAITGVLKEKLPGPSEEHIAKIEEAYGFLEKYLEASPYLAADHVTLADVSIVAAVSTLNLLVPIKEKYVKLREWFDRIQKEDWYQKGNQPGLEILEGILKQMTSKA